MNRALACLMLLLVSCSGTEESLRTSESFSLVRLAKLPPLPFDVPTSELRLVFLLGVHPDGTVREARLLTPTKSDQWNADAADSIRQWRYAPFAADSTSALRWIRNTVIVRLEKPTLMNIGVLNASRREEADSLHALLRSGAPFDSLAISRTGTRGPAAWYFPSIDLSCYPTHIREAIARLDVDECTSPIALGSQFVIYQRFDEGYAPPIGH